MVALTLLFGIGVGVAGAVSTVSHWDALPAADREVFDPVSQSLDGFQYAQLIMMLLGVLVVGAEHGSGEIDATFAATPRRGLVFLAKAAVLGALTLVVSLVAVFGAFFACQAALAGKHLDVGLGAPHVLRAVLAAALYLTIVTLLGLGLAAVLRNTGAAIAVAFGLVFLAWPAARAVEGVSRLPDRLVLVNAAERLVATRPISGPHAYRIPSFGMAVLDLALYSAVLLAAGAWRFTRDP